MARSNGAEPLLRGPYGRVTWSLCALVSLYAFEEMGVAAALPDAVADVGGLDHFGWVYTGFLATSVIGMSSSAYLCDRYGPRRPIIACVAMLVAGLVVAGTATTMTALVAGRVVQGLAGGGLMTAVYVVAGSVIPAPLRPRLFAAIASCWVVPGIVGPLASGAITEHLSWRWIFLGIAPVAAAAAVMLIPALPADAPPPARGESSAPNGGTARILSAAVAAAGIAAIQLGAGRPTAVAPLVITCGVAALVAGVRRLVPVGTVQLRSPVGAPVALRGIAAGALFGVESVIPLMLTTQHGLGPLQAAIPLACAGLPCALAAWWIGRAADDDAIELRVRMARLGFVLLGVADAAFVWLSRPAAPSWLMGPAWVLAGIGVGFVVPSMNVLTLSRTTDAERSVNASSLQIADTTMACLTTGFAGVLVGYASRGSLGFTTAFATIGVAMTLLSFLGAWGSTRLRLAPSTGEAIRRRRGEVRSRASGRHRVP
jgi:MFS family permease